MYYNSDKERPNGARLEGGKLTKRVHKTIDQMKRHDPDVDVSLEPTKYLLVGNSSVLCGVSLEELESILLPFDENAQFVVFPSKKTYSFVECSNVECAIKMKTELHGYIHPSFKTSHQPLVFCFVSNLPKAKLVESFRPADLEIFNEFVNEDFEKEIVDFIFKHPKLDQLKHRAVLHFGHEFDYDTNSAWKKCEDIPAVLQKIVEILMDKKLISQLPDQVTANVYEPGQGIPSHYDTHSAFDDPIVSLSLLSDVVMEFKDGANSTRVAPVLLPRRSLSLIKGESRYRWKHGIVNRKYDVDPRTNRVVPRALRVSLTFRKIRTKPCNCAWKEFCDWDREGEMGVPSNDSSAQRIEDAYVADVYEQIAKHFDETRHSNWKAVQSFLDGLTRSSLLVDVGCGNGKYLISNDGLVKIGCDMCYGLCQIASSKACEVLRADALRLPYRDSCADAVICIAVLHHMATEQRRRHLIKELLRILRPSGRACVTVWSMEQEESQYARMRSNKDEDQSAKDLAGEEETRLRVHDGKCFQQQDVFVPWVDDQQNETFLRYYHVFREGECEQLVASVEGCRLVSIVKEQGNYVFVIEKL